MDTACVHKYMKSSEVQEKIIESPYSTFPALLAEIYLYVKCNAEEFVIPVKKSLNGLILESLGRNADGGLLPLNRKPKHLQKSLIYLLDYLLKHYPIVTTTTRNWSYPHDIGRRELMRVGIKVISTAIYPRVLFLKGSFDDYFMKISKKARNRYRFFFKNKGIVEKAEPIQYLLDIYKVNLSSPIRQGKKLPKSYLDYSSLKKTVNEWQEYKKKGIADFYLAKINDKVVGYAFIPFLNKHAFVSRFLVHKAYLKYGVSNALLIEIIREFYSNNKAFVIQYGYWRNANPGINHFLQQHGFMPVRETYSIFYKNNFMLAHALKQYVYLTNIINPGKARFISNYLIRSIEGK